MLTPDMRIGDDLDMLYNRYGILMRQTTVRPVPGMRNTRVDGSVDYDYMFVYELDPVNVQEPNYIPVYINYDSTTAMPSSQYAGDPKESAMITAYLPTLEQIGKTRYDDDTSLLPNWKYLTSTFGLVLKTWPIGIDPRESGLEIKAMIFSMSGLIVPYEDHYELKMRQK
jgi:hypothetical protein